MVQLGHPIGRGGWKARGIGKAGKKREKTIGRKKKKKKKTKKCAGRVRWGEKPIKEKKNSGLKNRKEPEGIKRSCKGTSGSEEHWTK